MLSRLANCGRVNLLPTYRLGVTKLSAAHASSDAPYIQPPPLPLFGQEGVQSKEPLAERLNIRFGPDMPTIHDDKKPERDLKNFPRPKRALYPSKTRMFIVPESWFQFFYNKTGVTGPYVFGAGFGTFLASKEWWVYEHEFWSGWALFWIFFVLIRKFGPGLSKYLGDIQDAEEREWSDWQKGMVAWLDEYVDREKLEQTRAKGQAVLFDAKRENVKMQLEAEYRRRLMVAYEEVRRRLEYQLAQQSAERQYAQNHMVSWIINSVQKSISPQQEKEALQKCIVDLKALAASRPASI